MIVTKTGRAKTEETSPAICISYTIHDHSEQSSEYVTSGTLPDASSEYYTDVSGKYFHLVGVNTSLCFQTILFVFSFS